MEMQTEGYLIVLKPDAAIAAYAVSDVATRNPQALQELREVFVGFPPERYRGISREPLTGYPSLDSNVIRAFEDSGCDMKSNARARRRFREILGESDEDIEAQTDDDLLPSLTDARNVLSLVDIPSTWEIIRVSKGDDTPAPWILGIDIGYWGGDHFSLIADTIVTPCWHTLDVDDFEELGHAFSSLNGNLLFGFRDDAERFREYYKSQSWAETEDSEGQFCVIRVDGVE